MKTINFIKTAAVLTAFLFITASGFANNEPTDTNKKLKRKIGAHLSYPEFAKKNNINGEVSVKVSIGEDGKLKVDDGNGQPQLYEYVKTKIENIKINKTTKVKDSFIYKIVFSNN